MLKLSPGCGKSHHKICFVLQIISGGTNNLFLVFIKETQLVGLGGLYKVPRLELGQPHGKQVPFQLYCCSNSNYQELYSEK